MSEAEEFFEALRRGDEAQTRRMLDADPGLASARSGEGVPAVLWACYNQQAALARLVAERKAELDVFEAAALGETRRLEELLEEDAGLARAFSADGFQALHLAAFFGQPEAARLLLERGAPPDEVSRNSFQVQPLHSAAASRARAICRMLLDAGADPNARQPGGFVPLHAAGQNGDAGLAKLLLVMGANRAARNEAGKTAYDLAVENGYSRAAALLDPELS